MASDHEALCQWRQGDLVGFEILYRRHFPHLHRWLVWRLQDPEEAEDLAQETFLRALKCRDVLQIEPEGSLYPWLHTVAEHLLTDLRRKRQPMTMSDLSPEVVLRLEASLVSPSLSPEEAVLQQEWYALLRRAVDALPQDQRRVVEYRFFADLSWREIAQAMSRSEAAAKMLLQRAVARLRRSLETEIEATRPSRIRRQRTLAQEEASRERIQGGRQRPSLRGGTGTG